MKARISPSFCSHRSSFGAAPERYMRRLRRMKILRARRRKRGTVAIKATTKKMIILLVRTQRGACRHCLHVATACAGSSCRTRHVSDEKGNTASGAEEGPEGEGSPDRSGEVGGVAGEDAGLVLQPFRDSNYELRRPAAAFEEWKSLEALVLSLNRKNIRSCVVCAGILYGEGEQQFHDIFKAAWLAERNAVVVGPGSNVIPTVHVKDCAALVRRAAARCIESLESSGSASASGKDKDDKRYFLCVDESKLTQRQLVEGIHAGVGDAHEATSVEPDGDGLRLQDDIVSIDLLMEPTEAMRDEGFPWHCRRGVVAHIHTVASEFAEAVNLRPIKVLLSGPPGIGKSHFGAQLAQRYNVPHLRLADMVQAAAADNTNASLAAAANAALKSLPTEHTGKHAAAKKSAPKPPPPLSDELITLVVKRSLQANTCRYRGYVLDGVPGAYKGCLEVFMTNALPAAGKSEREDEGSDEDAENDEDEDETESANQKLVRGPTTSLCGAKGLLPIRTPRGVDERRIRRQPRPIQPAEYIHLPSWLAALTPASKPRSHGAACDDTPAAAR
eukprot:GHVU01145897.1.p1 GENE.GHVU01145897.1~~GHVU01145897.1.p1  ORF type:complete len:559 (-),score=64.79 GHVU01145897.1:2485-4161(-)